MPVAPRMPIGYLFFMALTLSSVQEDEFRAIPLSLRGVLPALKHLLSQPINATGALWMNLRQMTAWGQSRPDEEKGPELPNAERFLTLLVKGTALGVPEVDSELYKEFRSQVAKLALQLPDRLPDEEKLAQIRAGLSDFEKSLRRSESQIFYS